MDVEELKQRVDMLKRKLERCERHVESVNERLGQAEASRTDPARRRGYTDRYGHGYVKQFRDDRDVSGSVKSSMNGILRCPLK